MTLVIPEGFAEVAIQMRRAGDPDPWYVTFGADITAYADNYVVCSDNIYTWFVNNLESYLSSDATFSGIQLRVGTGGTDPLTLFYPKAAGGTSAGTTLPQNCAVLVTKQTFRPGRTGKGRMFWPQILEGEVNGLGQIESTFRNGMNNKFTDWFDNMAAGVGSDPGCPLYLLHNSGVPGGSTPTLIAGLSVDPIISTQRRRLR